jgi:glutaminyl-tRNA synthetase
MSDNADTPSSEGTAGPSNFVREIIDGDLAAGNNGGRVHTRFPPEPNGYLHIGHAKSVCLNFGLARTYGGKCNLRFDDTNPTKEETEYVESIQEDIKWLGFHWDELHFTSDYFDQLHAWAVQLIAHGKAYVDTQPYETIREQRGTLTRPGTESPHRSRSVEENKALFEQMRSGELDEGAAVLRAKIDMASPNLNLRDPILYRILKAAHHRTGDKWCIYPMYDWAHGQSDAIEHITHSVCTLEFENHRPLYDWYLDTIAEMGTSPEVFSEGRPRQIEFAKLNVSYMLMSKRKLVQLVQEKIVDGWDDPRMATLSGLRRRGYTPTAIRNLCDDVGVAKRDGVVEIQKLEHYVRQDLEQHADRVMVVLDPIKVVIDNYPEGQVEEFDMPYHPSDERKGKRKVPFGRELYIERDDFMEDPPKKFFRLAPGKEVRLRYAYFVTCTDVIKDDDGNITELRCTYDPATRGGGSPDGRKVKGTLHWVSADQAVPVEARLYDHLWTVENPGAQEDFREVLNPESLTVITAQAEPSIAEADVGQHFQFERKGYFICDRDSDGSTKVFNRTVGLRDSWAKIAAKGGGGKKGAS